MRFARNNSPNSDNLAPSNALFYSDPTARVLVLMAKQQGPSATGMHWMFINESFFRPTSHPDRRMVPWSYWSQFCLIREFNQEVVVGHPHVIGSRVVYLEKDGTLSNPGSDRTRLSVIDFSPYAEIPPPPAKLWTLLGKQSPLRPSETRREFPPTSTGGLAVESIRATEDNVVLVLVSFTLNLRERIFNMSALVPRKITATLSQLTSSPLVFQPHVPPATTKVTHLSEESIITNLNSHTSPRTFLHIIFSRYMQTALNHTLSKKSTVLYIQYSRYQDPKSVVILIHATTKERPVTTMTTLSISIVSI